MTIDELDLHGNEYAKCPYCGYEDQDSWELRPDRGEAECGRCGEAFHYERQIEITYDTSKITK